MFLDNQTQDLAYSSSFLRLWKVLLWGRNYLTQYTVLLHSAPSLPPPPPGTSLSPGGPQAMGGWWGWTPQILLGKRWILASFVKIFNWLTLPPQNQSGSPDQYAVNISWKQKRWPDHSAVWQRPCLMSRQQQHHGMVKAQSCNGKNSFMERECFPNT